MKAKTMKLQTIEFTLEDIHEESSFSYDFESVEIELTITAEQNDYGVSGSPTWYEYDFDFNPCDITIHGEVSEMGYKVTSEKALQEFKQAIHDEIMNDPDFYFDDDSLEELYNDQ